MTGPQDPLDRLRQAWQAEQPPLPSESLQDADERTQAIVRRLQLAWRAEDAPAPDLPEQALESALERNGILRTGRPRWTWRVLALAAGLFAAWMLWRPLAPSDDTSTVASNDSSTPSSAQDSSQPNQISANPPSVPPPAGVTKMSLRRDGFEARSGSVTLVLLQPNTPSNLSNGDSL